MYEGSKFEIAFHIMSQAYPSVSNAGIAIIAFASSKQCTTSVGSVKGLLLDSVNVLEDVAEDRPLIKMQKSLRRSSVSGLICKVVGSVLVRWS
ncbi:MAG: hypothetical protein ACI92G_004149 [Candidatus Pelagisphaera sp.]|jgi:hypothetical protein